MALGNVHLTPQLVQAVRDAVDVVGIASEHTKLTRAGKRYQGLCPLHKEKTPSFSVDPTQGLFYCFGCGVGGDAIKLHMLLSGDDFPAAIEALAQRYGIPLPRRTQRPAGGGPQRDVQGALRAAAEFFAKALERSERARGYLAERRIPAEQIERFGLGYAPDDWRELLRALSPRVPVADLLAAGLIATKEGVREPYDRFRNRLIFPIHAPSGRLVGFGGRTLGDERAKYINTAETEEFHKSRLLYGLTQAKVALRDAGRALLVEGYFDVIGAAASGVEWAVAGMGTSLTAEQARLLSRYADEVVVGFDGDDAGETAFRRALPLLLGEGLAVRRADFGAGHDPDSLRLEAGPEAVARAVADAPDAVMLELERLIPKGLERDPHTQAEVARRAGELLRPLKDPVERLGYQRLASQRLRVPEEIFAGLVRSPKPVPAQRELRPEGPEPPRGEGGGPRLVRSLEEQVLAVLFSGGPTPPADELPPPEAFLDPACRNIYREFCALYRQGRGVPPEPRDVLAELGTGGAAVDRMARIGLERASASSSESLPALLGKLWRRFHKERKKALRIELDEAQRVGDAERLERLLAEQEALSRSLHQGSGEPSTRSGQRGFSQ